MLLEVDLASDVGPRALRLPGICMAERHHSMASEIGSGDKDSVTDLQPCVYVRFH